MGDLIARPLSSENRQKPAGEIGVWIVVIGDMFVFGLFFLVYLFYRSDDLELYIQSQATLNHRYGLLNTLILLSSSWFVALGVIYFREHQGKLASIHFSLAIFLGLTFVAIKVLEYHEKSKAGIGITSNDFFMYYFIYTGLHLIHVLIGIGVLIVLCVISRSHVFSEQNITSIESGAIFWHLVDLLWIILFPLFYLIR